MRCLRCIYTFDGQVYTVPQSPIDFKNKNTNRNAGWLLETRFRHKHVTESSKTTKKQEKKGNSFSVLTFLLVSIKVLSILFSVKFLNYKLSLENQEKKDHLYTRLEVFLLFCKLFLSSIV